MQLTLIAFEENSIMKIEVWEKLVDTFSNPEWKAKLGIVIPSPNQ